MELWQVYAYMKGYKRRMLARASQALYTGFWSGYYHNAKRPKSPKHFYATMEQQMSQADAGTQFEAPDVETFMRRENARIQKLKAKVKEQENSEE